MLDPLLSALYAISEIKRLWREPRSMGRTALNMARFAEMEPERESDMSDPKLAMEVPPQVRDFAVKSVGQAERAISSFLESTSKSVAMVPSPMNDLGQS